MHLKLLLPFQMMEQWHLDKKKNTLFEVDAKTGSIVQIHAMSDPVNASAPWSDGRQSYCRSYGEKKLNTD